MQNGIQSKAGLPKVKPRAPLNKIRMFIERWYMGANPFGCLSWSEERDTSICWVTQGQYWARLSAEPITKGGWGRNGKIFLSVYMKFLFHCSGKDCVFTLFGTPLQMSCLGFPSLFGEGQQEVERSLVSAKVPTGAKKGRKSAIYCYSFCYIPTLMTKWHNLGSDFQYQE